jgi:hypothetical protein
MRAHLVANLPHPRDRLPFRIFERPILPPHPRHDRALFAVDQLWTFVSAGGGGYYVVNVGTGLLLDDNSGGAGVVCNQWGWQPDSAPNQSWTLVSN